MKNSYIVINPLVVFSSGWLLWFLIFWISPFETDVDFYMRHPAFNFWLICLGYFVAGTVLSLFLIRSNKDHRLESLDVAGLSKTLFFFLMLCFIIDSLQLVDFLYKSGGATNLVQARQEFRASDTIYPRVVASSVWVLSKLSIFPIFIVLIAKSKKHKIRPLEFYFSLLIAFYTLINLLVFGKRSFMIFTLGLYASYFLYFRLWQVKGLVFKAMVIMLVLFIGSYVTFNARYGGKDFALLDSIQAGYSYAATVLPTPEIIEEIETNISKRNNLMANIQISAVNFAQYYTHGTFEFFPLYDFNQGKPRANGTITLSMPYKILNLLGIINIIDYKINEHEIDPKPWIFDSFLGGQLKDWGDKAMYSMFIIGFIFGLTYRAAQSSPFLFPIYAILCNMVFFMPVTDMIYNAQGWHYITLALVFYLYMRAKTNFQKSQSITSGKEVKYSKS